MFGWLFGKKKQELDTFGETKGKKLKPFTKKERAAYMASTLTIKRGGFEIKMSHADFDTLIQDRCHLSIVKHNGKPSTVQVMRNRCDGNGTEYVGTLKSYFKVKSFKNGNTCDFRPCNTVRG